MEQKRFSEIARGVYLSTFICPARPPLRFSFCVRSAEGFVLRPPQSDDHPPALFLFRYTGGRKTALIFYVIHSLRSPRAVCHAPLFRCFCSFWAVNSLGLEILRAGLFLQRSLAHAGIYPPPPPKGGAESSKVKGVYFLYLIPP